MSRDLVRAGGSPNAVDGLGHCAASRRDPIHSRLLGEALARVLEFD